MTMMRSTDLLFGLHFLRDWFEGFINTEVLFKS
jgi:hypothetical protein